VTDTPEGTAESVVELRVPASSAFVAVLRSVTAGLAARCDLTLDEIEDLRIAVDEACALLLPLARPDTILGTRFELGDHQLVVSATVDARPGAEPSREGFGWTVLDALASKVEVSGVEDAITITLTKRREAAHQ
jgi:serine/threonine-protein kinase RsbW